MRKTAIFILPFLAALCFAQAGEQSEINEALGHLEATTRSFLAFTVIIMFAAGILLAAACAIIYLLKLKGVQHPPGLWLALGIIAGAIGILCLLGAAAGFAIYFLAPLLVRGLVSGPGI